MNLLMKDISRMIRLLKKFCLKMVIFMPMMNSNLFNCICLVKKVIVKFLSSLFKMWLRSRQGKIRMVKIIKKIIKMMMINIIIPNAFNLDFKHFPNYNFDHVNIFSYFSMNAMTFFLF